MRRSRIMHDKPMKPLERAVFWVEYVLRNNGAYHFRSNALDLQWYQYLLLDVVGFIILSLLTAFSICFVLIKRVCSNSSQQTKNVKKTKKND